MAAFDEAVINALGKRIVSVLGLQAKKGAPKDYMGKVTAGFGAHAFQLLRRQGLIEVVPIRGDVLNQYIPGMGVQPTGKSKKGVDIYPTYTYVKVVRNNQTLKPIGVGKEIREAMTGSQSVLDKLFRSDATLSEASWTPVAFSQKTTDTGQKISAKQRKILEKAQAIPHRVIGDMWSALQVLGDEVILKAAGWKDPESAHIQANNLDAVLAQNNNLETQLDGMTGLVQRAIAHSPKGLLQAFYANFDVWKNYRVGITTRDMNLQSSKIHRYMFARPTTQGIA